ncbi:MAG: TRAP transporter small permease [Caldimonas sp.]
MPRLLLRIPEAFIAVLLALLIGFLVASVVSRYIMDIGVPWSDEVARLLFIWIVFIGFAVAVRQRSNVGVDWLVNKLAPKRRWVVTLLQDGAILVFAGYFTWQSQVTVGFSLMQRMPGLDITIAWLYASALVCGALMILYAASNLIDTLSGKDVAAGGTHAISAEDAITHIE